MAFMETLATARNLLPRGAAMAPAVGDAGLGFDLDIDGAVRFLSGLWDLIVVKAAELAGFLARKADELLPPETRSETLRQWLHVAVTVVLPAALAALVLFCLARCCFRCCFRCFCRCCRCFCRCFRGGGRMMFAPGRRGARMPRNLFEGDPRGYFRDLHAGKALVY